MDQTKFLEAQQAYDSGDYRTAAKSFLASAGKGAAGNGAAYHMAGNALMRLRRHHDAVTVYGHALRDDAYDKRGAVHANLGTAHIALGDYAEAVKSYEAALEEPDYACPYKAYQGMASALVERGRFEEAAGAYRKAALDPANPDPGKALVNLGLCFMALGRPEDAADAYKAALGFDQYQGRGKALANLGQALAAAGQYEEAVRAFEKATQLHGHKLSPAAQGAYDDAVAAASSSREVVEGWETGEIDPAVAVAQAQGWDTDELQALAVASVPAAIPPADDEGASDLDPDAALGIGGEEAVNDFFARTEDEMKAHDREARRAERAQRRAESGWLKPVLWTLAVVVAASALFVFGYWYGLGWPLQHTTVNGLVSAYSGGQPVDAYWVAVPERDVAREMAKIPPVESFTVDGIVRGPRVSSVKLTVTPENGSPLRYTVMLAREGVGWKVTGIENDWRSTGD